MLLPYVPHDDAVRMQAATLGDPRRPQEVRKISSVTIPAVDDTFSQTILLAAMTCGVSGLMFQVTLRFDKALLGNRSKQQEHQVDVAAAPQTH